MLLVVILMFVAAVIVFVTGLMWITGYQLDRFVDTGDVTEEQVQQFSGRWNAHRITVVWGVSFIVFSICLILTAISLLTGVCVLFIITLAGGVLYALVTLILVTTLKYFGGENYGRNKNVKNKTE